MSDDLFLGIVIGLSCFLYALVLYMIERNEG
jgi:hypothetical protein